MKCSVLEITVVLELDMIYVVGSKSFRKSIGQFWEDQEVLDSFNLSITYIKEV